MKQESQKLAEESLGPLIEAIDKKRGLLREFTDKLSQANGTKLQRQQVGTWLDKDKKKRSQPRYGMGLLMLRVGREMQIIE